MISKRSFHKMMLFDLRQRGWLMLLLTIVELLLIPVRYLIRLQNATYNYIEPSEYASAAGRAALVLQNKIAVAQGFFSIENRIDTGVLLAGAFVAALTGYAWLCSRQKVDFYHSLSLRRSQLYWIPFADGVLIVLVPYLVCALIAFFGIGSVHGVVTAETIHVLLRGFADNILLFLAAYALCVLAVVISGRVLIGGLLSVMFVVYGPLAVFIYSLLMPWAFETYLDRGQESAGLYSSPAGIWLLHLDQGRIGVAGLLMLAVFAAGCTAAGLVCYRRRPSEAAGNAYVHPVLEAVIKVAVAIPSGMVFGLLFQSIGYSRPRFWFVCGAVAGVLAACALMEAVQSVDLKNILRRWRSSAVAVAGTVLILVLLLFDPFGYDSYLPKEQSIESVGILSQEWTLADQCGYTDYFYYREPDRFMKLLEEMTTTDTAAVYPLLQEGVANAEAHENGTAASNAGISAVIQLKNGQKRYRSYNVSLSTLRETMQILTENRAYREQIYPVNHLTAEMFDHISAEDWITSPDGAGSADQTQQDGGMKLNENERKALVEALKIDLNGCSLGKLYPATPLGTLSLEQQSADGEYYNSAECPTHYYIYPF
ncbi:MAG: hypothetical protein IJ860_06320, partial [Eubacterium sp.]|nr:hypothetical protein [Eubacterium sp.]